jgi:hypothetical protein
MGQEDSEMSRTMTRELHSVAIQNNYCIFRLGQERIIIAPSAVQVEVVEKIGRKDEPQVPKSTKM